MSAAWLAVRDRLRQYEGPRGANAAGDKGRDEVPALRICEAADPMIWLSAQLAVDRISLQRALRGDHPKSQGAHPLTTLSSVSEASFIPSIPGRVAYTGGKRTAPGFPQAILFESGCHGLTGD
jgi:hypothetical protein